MIDVHDSLYPQGRHESTVLDLSAEVQLPFHLDKHHHLTENIVRKFSYNDFLMIPQVPNGIQ